jgi:hypothetical protein
MGQFLNDKHIGLVKWFHDKAKNADYGFIQHATLGDLYFNDRSIDKSQDIYDFKENELVVFVSKPSRKKIGSLEAIEVKLLSSETDLHFLFRHFLLNLFEKGKYSEYNTIQKAVHSRIHQLFDVVDNRNFKDELFVIYKDFLSVKLNAKDYEDDLFIKGFINVCKDIFPESYTEISKLIEDIIGPEKSHILWLDKYLENCQIVYVSNIIIDCNLATQTKIFNRCSLEEKSNIFYSVLYKFEKIDSSSKFGIIKEFLKLSKKFAIEKHEEILNSTLEVCPSYYKLILWLEDYHENLEFDIFKLYTITLATSDQKKFVKKALKYVHEGRAEISLEDFISINVIDYEVSKIAENYDKSKLDFSTSIMLNTISELYSQNQLETIQQKRDANRRIFEIIIKQIKEPKEILEIKGFFDECEGRCSISCQEIKDDDGMVIEKIINYHRKENQKSKLHPICDGRKAIDKKSGLAILDDKGLEFWWCANQMCYKPSRILHGSSEWEKYSLLDFLTILKVPFVEQDYEVYLALINKANRFLAHLNCLECGDILRPKGNLTNYAFWGVNDFHCTNKNCSQNGIRVYLSHCLNGKCEQVIDSRKTVKCRPEGFASEVYGWYVCNYCHSCCSDDGLERRRFTLQRNGQAYDGHVKGHRDLGVIPCDKCGDTMDSKEINLENYQNALEWFLKNRENHTYIHKSGVNSNNKNWFRFAQGGLTKENYFSQLLSLKKLGFHIPDLNISSSVHLVAEPFDLTENNRNILYCKSCENVLDLTVDIERSVAVKSFHKIKFPRQNVDI